MLKLMRKSKKNRYLPHFCFSLVVVTLNVIWLERELGTDGHRVAALMYTRRVTRCVSDSYVYWWL